MTTPAFDQLKLFDNLTPVQASIVRGLFVSVTECAGAVIFNQGDPAEYLYIVADGEVLIQFKPYDGPWLTIARIRPDGVVGWSAALGSPEYTSSAICSTECSLLRVSGDDLRTLCDRYPETGSLVLEQLAAVIAKRIRNTHAHVLALLEQGMRLGLDKPAMAG